MLSNAYFLAKIGADTAENEQHFAEILPIVWYVQGSCRCGARPASGRAPPLEPNKCPRFKFFFDASGDACGDGPNTIAQLPPPTCDLSQASLELHHKMVEYAVGLFSGCELGIRWGSE